MSLFNRAIFAALVVLCACATPHSTTAPVSSGAALTPPALRLPSGVRPTGYQLELKVIPGEETFSGVTSIRVNVDAPTQVLWLHAKELTIAKVEATTAAGVVSAQAELYPPDFMAVRLEQPLPAGAATLRFTYTGILSRKNIAGLFQLRDRDDDYAYTQLEATDARRAFPSFDEPQFKVPFDVSVVVKKEHLAFGNNPVRSEEALEGGLKKVTFTTTPALPTYLVAVAVGPFEIVDAGQWGKKKTPVRTITPRGKSAEARLAGQLTGPILETLENYFDIPYPFEKLDQISIPSGFGAMENPGLITYGHALILVPQNEETPQRQRRFASVCAHELAHQWFGNLVTMAWWNDIWLNEAFASWVGLKAVKTWKPAWSVDLNRVDDLDEALSADALVSARQIRQPIESVDDIANAFDSITYDKGSAVIAMYENLVGAEPFRKGVRRYLTERAGGSGTSTDFIAALAAESRPDIAASFDTFLDHPGAPLLAVNLVCDRGAKPKLTFAQSRYLPLGSTGAGAQTWQLPVCVRYSVAGKEERLCTLLTQGEGEQVLEKASRCPDWVLPNDGMQGYYRGHLGGRSSSVSLIKSAWTKLSEPERLGLLYDLQAEVEAGQVTLDVALLVVPLAARETNYRIVRAAIRLVSLIDERKLVEPSQQAQYESYIRSVFGPRAKQVGLSVGPKEDENARLLRPPLLAMVGGVGNDKALQAQALPLAKTWVQLRKGIEPELLETVLGIAARTGEAEFHAQLQQALMAEKDPAQRNYLLQALGAFIEPALVNAHLALTLDPTLKVTEAMGLLGSAASHPRTEDVAFEFLKNNWQAVVKRMPEDWAAYLTTIANGFCDAAHRAAAQQFFDGRTTKFPGGPRIFASTMETIDLCIKYRQHHQSSAAAFLQKQPAKK